MEMNQGILFLDRKVDSLVSHAWCDSCKAVRLALFEKLSHTSLDGCYIGGDVVCGECYLVIATLYKRNPVFVG